LPPLDDLRAEVGLRRGVSWGVRRLPLVLPLAAVTAAAGWVVFLVPYWLADRLAAAFRAPHDQVATSKLLVGIAVYASWVVTLVAVATVRLGPRAAVLVLQIAPLSAWRAPASANAGAATGRTPDVSSFCGRAVIS